MQEAVQESPAGNLKMPDKWLKLTPLQKDIYKFLSTSTPMKALHIAKAVKKNRAAEVNPDLYKMKDMNLTKHDDSKFWFITTEDNADNGRMAKEKKRTESEVEVQVAAQRYPNMTETKKMTEQQEKIYSYLKENKPQRAIVIAKEVGRKCAKDVNPDLYLLKTMDLISHNEKEKLWTIKSLTSTAIEPHESSTYASGYIQKYISENTPPILTQDANYGCRPSNDKDGSQDKDSSTEATPAAAEYTTMDGPNMTEPLTGENNMQNYTNWSNPPSIVNKSYVFNIYHSQNFSIGDKMRLTSYKENVDPALATEYQRYEGQTYESDVTMNTTLNQTQYEDPGYQPFNKMDASRDYDSGIGNDTIWTDLSDPHITAQEGEQQDLTLCNNNQKENDSANDSSLLHTESGLMLQNQLALTSSPIVCSHSVQTLNISDICDELENVTLDEKEEQSTTSCSISSVTDSFS
ncbi:Z-DNA-binding protein 1 [Mixophyes fleayi]|uniref:Z-DNA-binding protein 1 n=1 Tax=Mixophyes fleayi TaxID=3061075 RepID=UPI003F4DD06E